MNQGIFITLEGGEASGKTTTSQILQQKLEADGYEVLLTREPGGIDVSEQIRSIIMDNDIEPQTEVLLFAAARVEHLYKKVLPALKEGNIVLCDRYIDSSLVYQGYTREMGVDAVAEINYWATDHKLPDLTFFYDIEPNVALKRLDCETREINRFDKEKMEFHNKLYQGYKEIALANENRFKTIKADQDLDLVVNDIYTMIKGYING